MLLTPFFGYLYDLFGRKWLILTAFLIATAQMSVLPLSAPHFWLLCVFRTVMVCCSRLLHVHPLLIDYVKSESRGYAVSLASLGLVFGEFMMVSIFAATRKLEMSVQFWLPALIVASLSFTLLFLVREPELKFRKKETQVELYDQELTLWG